VARNGSPRTPIVRRPAVLIVSVLAGILLGIAFDIGRAGGPETWMALHGIGPPYDTRGRLVQVEGRNVYLDCRGSGSPTVVLEAGFGSGASSWGFVLDRTAAFTRVCAWDRPGIGRSAARGGHSGGEAMHDLRGALRSAGEVPPFILVPHSLGGVYSRIFAGAYPAEVVGFVTIDTYDPDIGLEDVPTLPLDFRERHRRQLADTGAVIASGEQLDWATTLQELDAVGPLPQPAILLYVDQHLRFAHEDAATQALIIVAWERVLRGIFPNGRVEMVPNTDHQIHLLRPTLVIDRIREVVESARAPGAAVLTVGLSTV
jgi:pimeloyl-ACP methyl ester carboxylesterase